MTAPVLYLDADGVLHHDEVYWSRSRGVYMDIPERSLFEYAPLLVTALAAFPEVRIVLSTTWVRQLGYSTTVDCLRRYCGRPFASRVIGSTYHSEHTPRWDEMTRYQQIRKDASRRGLGNRWVAIDNDDEGWPDHARDQLVHTQDYGLRPIDIDRLVSRLQELTK